MNRLTSPWTFWHQGGGQWVETASGAHIWQESEQQEVHQELWAAGLLLGAAGLFLPLSKGADDSLTDDSWFPTKTLPMEWNIFLCKESAFALKNAFLLPSGGEDSYHVIIQPIRRQGQNRQTQREGPPLPDTQMWSHGFWSNRQLGRETAGKGWKFPVFDRVPVISSSFTYRISCSLCKKSMTLVFLRPFYRWGN